MHLEISFPETVDGNKPHYAVYYEAGKTEVHPPIVSDLCPLPDPDIGEDNLIEAKHHKLARSLGRVGDGISRIREDFKKSYFALFKIW